MTEQRDQRWSQVKTGSGALSVQLDNGESRWGAADQFRKAELRRRELSRLWQRLARAPVLGGGPFSHDRQCRSGRQASQL